MAEPRTKQTALDTLMTLREEILQKMEDTEIASLLTPDLLQSVFNAAWRLQFDDEVAQFQRAARDLVTEASDQSLDGAKR